MTETHQHARDLFRRRRAGSPAADRRRSAPAARRVHLEDAVPHGRSVAAPRGRVSRGVPGRTPPPGFVRGALCDHDLAVRGVLSRRRRLPPRAHFRREQLVPDAASVSYVAAPTPTPEREVEKRQAADRLQDILSTLNVEQRVVFTMFELEGLTCDQIGERTSACRSAPCTRACTAPVRRSCERCRGNARATRTGRSPRLMSL